MSENESLKSKLILTVLDKLILAALIAAFGFWLDGKLQNKAAVAEYQKSIYEKRESSYIAILDGVKEVDSMLTIHFTHETHNKDQIARKIVELINEYRSDVHGMGAGANLLHPIHVLEALKKLDSIVSKNNIYLPQEVILAIQEYEIAVIDSMGKEKKQPKDILNELRKKSLAIMILIKQRLGVEDVISG